MFRAKQIGVTLKRFYEIFISDGSVWIEILFFQWKIHKNVEESILYNVKSIKKIDKPHTPKVDH